MVPTGIVTNQSGLAHDLVTADELRRVNGGVEELTAPAPVLDRAEDPYRAAKDATAVVVLTGWPEFQTRAWDPLTRGLRERTVVDTRGVIDVEAACAARFTCYRIGRKPVQPSSASSPSSSGSFRSAL